MPFVEGFRDWGLVWILPTALSLYLAHLALPAPRLWEDLCH